MGRRPIKVTEFAKPYVHVKDLSESIIDRIYDNCTGNISEHLHLNLMGLTSTAIRAYNEGNADEGLVSLIESALRKYQVPNEDFISEFDGFKIVLFWAGENALIAVKKSPFMTNAAMKLNRSDNIYLNPNKKGRIKAYAIPESWWHIKPKIDHVATLIK